MRRGRRASGEAPTTRSAPASGRWFSCVRPRAHAEHRLERLLVTRSPAPARIVEALAPRLKEKRSQRRAPGGWDEVVEGDEPVAAVRKEQRLVLRGEPRRKCGAVRPEQPQHVLGAHRFMTAVVVIVI